jgi:hypothetical protein
MSILDFTTDLFREPASLRSFVDDPAQALNDAGLSDATPEQVLDVLPVVAESMPPDHPLQTVVHSADPVAALQALDIDDLIAEEHDHHHEVERMGKALGDPGEAARLQTAAPSAECLPDVDDQPIAEHIEVRNWGLSDQHEKGLGDVVDNPLTPEIEGDPVEPTDNYPQPRDEDESDHDHAVDDGLDDLDNSAVAWGKAID